MSSTTKTTFKILADEDLRKALAHYGLPEGGTVMSLIRRALSPELQGDITIEIDPNMVAASYTINVAMLKRNAIAGVRDARSIKVKMNGLIYVNISDVELKSTFMADLRHKLVTLGFAKFANDEIPVSYRNNPRIVEKHIKLPITTTKEKDSYTWQLTDS